MFSNVVSTGAEAMPFGMARVVAWLVFSLGLIMVVAGGAQIFTGDVLMVMAWVSRRITTQRVLRAWGIVWVGNLIGASGTALLALLAGHYLMGNGQVGLAALRLADAKAALPFDQAFFLAVLCNTLVCLAVWLSLSSRLPVHRAMLVVLPVAAFVASGFEHAVANMYIIGFGLMVKLAAPESFWLLVKTSSQAFTNLRLGGYVNNLVAVTAGNIVGGMVFVAGVYWVIYRRPGQSALARETSEHRTVPDSSRGEAIVAGQSRETVALRPHSSHGGRPVDQA
jgi:formate/nitrite transporter